VIASTTFIVLDKRPYRESALLLRGISPDYGRLSLVAHGAQSVTEKKFPCADLFRELETEFRDDDRSTLFTAGKLELVTDFDGIGNVPLHFKMAARMGDFLLKNLTENLAQPYTYDTFRSILSRLADPEAQTAQDHWTLEQCAVLLKTTFLYENGLLPEGRTPKQNEFLENLVAAGIENSLLPECDPKYWSSLNQWLNSLIDYHQLQR